MGRAFPKWAPRQVRSSGWHIREGGNYLPLRPLAGDLPIPVDDVQSMLDVGLLVRVSIGDRNAVAYREQRRKERHGTR